MENKIIIKDNRFYEYKGITYPRITSILAYYPQSYGLKKFLGDSSSFEEAERIKMEAARRGTAVHEICSRLIHGETVFYEELNSEEQWGMVQAFCNWVEDVRPKFIHNEYFVVSDGGGFAGTFDILAEVNGQLQLLDIKTSGACYPQYFLQTSAYIKAFLESTKQDLPIVPGVIRLGSLHKRHYEYKLYKQPWQEGYELFLAIKSIYHYENSGAEPKNKEYPSSLKLCLTNTSTDGSSSPTKANSPVKRKRKKNVPNVEAETGALITA